MSREIAFEFEANEEFVELCFPDGTGVHIDPTARALRAVCAVIPGISSFWTPWRLMTRFGMCSWR